MSKVIKYSAKVIKYSPYSSLRTKVWDYFAKQIHPMSLRRISALIIIIALIASDGLAQAEVTPPDSISFAPGIYYKNKRTRKYFELEPSILTNSKAGGAEEFVKRGLISGMFNAKLRAAVQNAQADLKIRTSNPLFYFVFDTNASSFATVGAVLVAQRPKDFMLIRMKRSRDSREIVLGKHNNISSSTGVDEKSKVSFSSTKIRRGVYEVTVNEPLEPGEYCFLFSVESQSQAMGTKVYDFSRPEPEQKQ
jgi:hypothetical protein